MLSNGTGDEWLFSKVMTVFNKITIACVFLKAIDIEWLLSMDITVGYLFSEEGMAVFCAKQERNLDAGQKVNETCKVTVIPISALKLSPMGAFHQNDMT